MKRKVFGYLGSLILILVILFSMMGCPATPTKYGTGYGPTGRTATIVVAASNASPAEKAQADYVVPSANASTTLQTAITAAAGGILKLEGSFNVGGELLGTSNIDIEGPATLVWTGSTYNPSQYDTLHRILDFESSSNFTLHNLTFNGAYGVEADLWVASSDHFKIEDSTAFGGNSQGGMFSLQGDSFGKIVNPIIGTIGGSDGSGINITEGSHDIQLTGEVARDTYDAPCSIGASGASPTYNIDVSDGNFIRNTGVGYGYGVDIFGSADNITVHNMYIYNRVSHGIGIHGNAALTYFPKRVTIDNVIIAGIGTSSCSGIYIISDNTSGVVQVSNFTIQMLSTGQDGVDIEAGNIVRLSDGKLEGNSATGYGVNNATSTVALYQNNVQIDAGFSSGKYYFTNVANYYEVATKELFVPVTATKNSASGLMLYSDQYAVSHVSASGNETAMDFWLPHDFTALRNLYLVFIADGSKTNMAIGINIATAASGQFQSTNAAGGIVYQTTTDTFMYATDISTFVPAGIAANQYGSVEVYYSSNTSIYIVGLRLLYR